MAAHRRGTIGFYLGRWQSQAASSRKPGPYPPVLKPYGSDTRLKTIMSS